MLDGRRRRPRRAADHALLAARPRAVHHAAGRDHAGPRRPACATSACTGCRRSTARTTFMHWQIHKDGRADLLAAPDGRIPVAVALGLDPVTAYSASAPLPKHIDELMVAGFLKGSAGRAREVQDRRPRGAGERGDRARGLGRRGRAAGSRAVRRPHRLLHAAGAVPRSSASRRSRCAATRSTRRSSSASRPPRTSGSAKATERIFLPAIRMSVPEIVDYDLPIAGRVPQLRDRLDPQALPRPRAQGDARDLGPRPALALEGGRRRRRARRRPRLRGGLLPRLRATSTRSATSC